MSESGQKFWCFNCSIEFQIQSNLEILCPKCKLCYCDEITDEDHSESDSAELNKAELIFIVLPQAQNDQENSTYTNQSEIIRAMISQLANFTENSYPTSSASEATIKHLQTIQITEQLNEQEKSCIICKEDFVLDQKVKILPCKHWYHEKCIVAWLKLKNNCPLCRFILEDEKEEIKENSQQAN